MVRAHVRAQHPRSGWVAAVFIFERAGQHEDLFAAHKVERDVRGDGETLFHHEVVERGDANQELGALVEQRILAAFGES